MKFWKTIGKALLAVWNYFRPSWEGTDGKFSYKRASQFVFLWLLIIMALAGVTTQWQFYSFLTIATLFALVAAVITVPELILMLKAYSKSKRMDYWNLGNNPDETTTEDQETETMDNEKDTNNIGGGDSGA